VSGNLSHSNRVARGQSVGLAAFLFGVAQREQLPGAVLTALLMDLGLTQAAARALISRMRQEGQLAGERRGRGVEYRPSGAFAQRFRAARDGARAEATQWSGSFHALLYQVPEAQRSFRDSLRVAAMHAGYGILQPGVLISPTDQRERLAPVLSRAPEGSVVHAAWLRMNDAAAARAAAAAWDLARLNQSYRAHTRALRLALERDPPPVPDAGSLRRLAELVTVAYAEVSRAVRLPPQLLPARWDLPELEAALRDVTIHYAPAMQSYIGGLIAGSSRS